MSLRPARFILPIVAALGSSAAAAAQDAAQDAATVAPREIVVTGRGLAPPAAAPAYSTAELSAERLGATASGRIEDALSGVAGVQQFRRSDSRSANPSAQGLTLRGLGGNATSRTLVLLDGVPLADPFFGYVPLSAIVPEHLVGLRVSRGGGSGAFGAGAVAGTIELTSAGPAQLGRGTALAMIDNRGETSASAAVTQALGGGFVVISGRWDRGEGFWTTPVAQRVAASVPAQFDGWSAALRGVAPLGGAAELQVRVAAFDDRRTLRFAGADTGSSGQEGSLRIVARGDWQVEALGYVQARDFSNVVISATSFRKTLDQYATPSTGLGGKLEVRPPLGGGHALRLGADWRQSDGVAREAAYNAAGAVTARRASGGRNSDLGLYAETDWRRGALVLTAGARADRWVLAAGRFTETDATGLVQSQTLFPVRSGWDGSLRGGGVLRLAPGLTLRTSAYGGSRLPTLNELYRPFTVFPVRTLANAALRNEQLVGFEAGLDLAPLPGVTLAVTAYDNRVNGAIANVTIATALRERRNVDAVRVRGIELDANLQLDRWLGGAVSLGGSLALTDARVRASGSSAALDGKRPAQTAGIAASATLAWAPTPRWRLALTVRHTGAQFEDDLETDRLPPATTLDAFAEVPLGRTLSLILRGENLADVDVITRNQAGSIDLGTPRTLWAGARLRWL